MAFGWLMFCCICCDDSEISTFHQDSWYAGRYLNRASLEYKSQVVPPRSAKWHWKFDLSYFYQRDIVICYYSPFFLKRRYFVWCAKSIRRKFPLDSLFVEFEFVPQLSHILRYTHFVDLEFIPYFSNIRISLNLNLYLIFVMSWHIRISFNFNLFLS
jgi:hypothetical protein